MFFVQIYFTTWLLLINIKFLEAREILLVYELTPTKNKTHIIQKVNKISKLFGITKIRFYQKIKNI